MAKDPAFLFYASDFLTGVQDLTMEERGVYITLLCLQHQKGHLTEKMIGLCHGIISADVMAKFSKDENGNFYNERLKLEIEKRKSHSEKQRQRALSGWEKRKLEESHGDATANATALPLENENINRNIIENKEGNENSKTSEESKKFAEWFSKELKPESMNPTEKDLESWAKTYDKLKKDGKTKEQIVAATKWARNDDFWAKNFQNPNKLRKKNKDEVFYIDVFLDQMKIQQIKKEEKPDPNKYVMKEKRNPVTGQ